MASLYITESTYSPGYSITAFGLDLPCGNFKVFILAETPEGVFIDNRKRIDQVLDQKSDLPEIRVRHISFD